MTFKNYPDYVPALVQLLQSKMEVLVKMNDIEEESKLVVNLIESMNTPQYKTLALFKNPQVQKMVADHPQRQKKEQDMKD